MKKTILLILTTFLIQSIDAQRPVDFNKVVVPTDSRAKEFKDYLVQLAWSNTPSNRVLEEEIEIAREEVSIKRWDWTKDFIAQFNYNESHFIDDFINDEDPNIPDPNPNQLFTIYPRFNFGASIPLGTILNNPKKRRQAEHELIITEHELNQEKLEIRAKTLERYEAYLVANEIVTTRKQAEDDAYQTYQLVKALFKKGEAKFDEVNSASTTYYKAKEGFISAESDVKVAIIQLEELIGIPFADALKYGPK